MNRLESYLRERYLETKWPYYTLNYAKYEIGESFDNDAKELRDKEMIRPTPGINGWLIEMINIETNWKINTQNK